MGVKSLQDRMKPSVYGVGFLGANTDLETKINGKICPIYRRWNGMLKRCYSERYQITAPTYINCIVSDEFKNYSKWREWYDNYRYKQEGWQLDKDLLVKGNKVYSRETCVFLPRIINLTLTKSLKSRGEYLLGVYSNTNTGRFVSSLYRNSKYVYLGTYDTEIEAHLAYKKAKESYLKELADKYKDLLDPRAYEALYNYTVDIDD